MVVNLLVVTKTTCPRTKDFETYPIIKQRRFRPVWAMPSLVSAFPA